MSSSEQRSPLRVVNHRLDEPPFDPEEDLQPAHTPEHTAEQAVLGAMLLVPEKTIPVVAGILRPADYAEPRHETIHDTLVAIHASGAPVDPVTVAQHLAQNPTTGGRTQLDQIGGPLYLHDLQAACPTPTSADHYADIVRTAARRRTIITTGTKIAQIGRTGTVDDLDQAFTTAYETLDTAAADFGPAAVPPTSWAPVDLTPVLAGDYLDPPPTMLRRSDGIPLLYDGMVQSIAGESESGKTWLTLLAARQLLDEQQRVVFIDFEDRADRVISRLLALGSRHDQIHAHFAYIRPDRPLDDTGRHQLAPAIAGARLVIVDGVTEAMTMHGLDLISNEHAAKFLELLPRWIADHGPAVVVIDHVVKDKEKHDRFAIGAQHKLAGINSGYTVKAIQPFARGKRGIAQIIVAKDRPGYVREQAFGKVIAEFALDGSVDDVIVVAELTPPGRISGRAGDQPWAPTHLMERISAYVAANPGLSKKSIEGVMNGKTDHKRLALELLVNRGYIRVETGPRGSTKHFHVNAYYESDDTTEPDPGDTDPTLGTGDDT